MPQVTPHLTVLLITLGFLSAVCGLRQPISYTDSPRPETKPQAFRLDEPVVIKSRQVENLNLVYVHAGTYIPVSYDNKGDYYVHSEGPLDSGIVVHRGKQKAWLWAFVKEEIPQEVTEDSPAAQLYGPAGALMGEAILAFMRQFDHSGVIVQRDISTPFFNQVIWLDESPLLEATSPAMGTP